MKNMKKMDLKDYLAMFFISLTAGFLSTMNIWVDKYSDLRTGLNDVYMVFLMTGWMFLFSGIYYQDITIIIIGSILVIINMWCIRTQFLVTEEQYKLGMIPHHSMAIHMSKKLLEKKNNMQNFLKNLINTQEEEIKILKDSN
jgi:hypothetical protein